MSATDRERVISGIVAGLEAMGRVKRVERSNWNSNPKPSESLRRFAERLRRTRVENAENVASSRSFLGILGKKSPKPSACWRFWRIVHPSILAPARKSYRDAPVLSRGISFNGLDGPDRLLLAQSGRCWCGSTNLHNPKVISCAGFAKRYAGYDHDGICSLCKFFGERRLRRAVNHFLIGMDVLRQDAVSTPQKAKLP